MNDRPIKTDRPSARESLEQWFDRVHPRNHQWPDHLREGEKYWAKKAWDAGAEAYAQSRGDLREVLLAHWPLIECDHANKRDRANCSCGSVDLGWHPSVGDAVKSWVEHVTGAQADAQKGGK